MLEERIAIPTDSPESMEIELGQEGLELILDSTNRFYEASQELLTPFQITMVDSVSPLGQLSDVIEEAHAELVYVLNNALEKVDDIDGAITDDQALDIQNLYDVLQDGYNQLVLMVAKMDKEEAVPTATTEKSAGEESDPDNDSVEVELKSKADLNQIFPSRPLGKDAILAPQILEDPEYQILIEKHFSSPAALEATLWRLVRSVEEPSKLDKLLGVKHGSIFNDVLKGRTIAEMQQLSRQSGERIRAVLAEMEREERVVYDYRIFVEWMEELHYLVWLLKPAINATVNELLIHYELLRREESL